ncbi:hypothetical protein BJY00DRAFT_184496 [Aspergillus carlsbadensis]|nr:hypothetical protein BJY00DRAFT_184496 [Aspergillus carlsbadensis]
MPGITVGEVSAMINAAIILIQVTFPLAIVLVIVGLMRDRESAATWTTVARSIQSSFWPTLLQSDHTLSKDVRTRLVALTWLTTIGTILLIIVGISTPLGLSEELRVGDTQSVTWEYAHDVGPMGQGTPDRAAYNYSRVCNLFNCPGVDGGYQAWRDDSGFWANFNASTDLVDLRIPRNMSEVFTSGTAGTSVASIFDMQYRSYQREMTGLGYTNYSNYMPYQNNSVYTVGKVSILQSVILNNEIGLVEGLVVDTINGGVGFRNHTVPADIGLGVEWQEEILWIEPVTECVDLNLTIEFNHVLYELPVGIREQSLLVDHGGMANLSEDFPFIDQNDTQGDPQLYATAYRAAAFTNLFSAVLFNLTVGKDPGVARLGAKYNLTGSMPPYPQYIPRLNEIVIGPLTGDFLPLPNFFYNATSDVTSDNFTMLEVGTQRFGRYDVVNMSTVGIKSGMVMGAPHLLDGSDTLVLDPETHWVQKLLTCSSATRASIKIVKFQANGTALSDIHVLRVSDKPYGSEAEMPLWAIERSNLTVADYAPLWGIIDDIHENSEALYTRRKEALWLPAANTYGTSLSYLSDSMPAGAHLKALAIAYNVDSMLTTLYGRDYSGKDDFGLYPLWRDLSRNSKTAGRMINLIWTDAMANLVLGTKPGPFSSEPVLGSSASYDRVVQAVERRVVYDIRYATPAFLMLVLWMTSLIAALILFLLSRVSIPALAQLTNQLASGRMATQFYHTDQCRFDAPTDEWAAKAGALLFIFQRVRGARPIEATETAGQVDDHMNEDRENDLRFGPLGDESTHDPSVPVALIMTGQKHSSSISKSQDMSNPEASSLMAKGPLPDSRAQVQGEP